MRLFIIDNYDSFTYNIVQYFGELGAEQEVVRNDAIGIDDLQLDGFDGLVISPGPCDPDRAGISLQAIERWAGKIPLLGVCLGHQSIGQAFGAKIIKDSNSGFVSNSENINDFVNSIISFNKLSNHKRQELGLNGRKYFEKEFERSKLLKRLIDIFDK